MLATLVLLCAVPPFAWNDPPPVYLIQWGSNGPGNGQFRQPHGVSIDASGNVYVADTNNHRIQKFDGAGTFLCKWGSFGVGDGQLNLPHGVAITPDDRLYIVDSFNDRVQEFDTAGSFVNKWGVTGSGDGQFLLPSGIAVSPSGNLYVVDLGNHRVQEFDAGGTFVSKWGTSGTGDGQFRFPVGVAVNGCDNVYVVDSSNHRVQVFEDPAFRLLVAPNAVSPGDATTLSSCSGEPGRPALLFVVDVDGTPFFLRVASGTLNGLGNWSLAAGVPDDPAFGGLIVTFRTLSFDGANKVVQTNDAVLTIL